MSKAIAFDKVQHKAIDEGFLDLIGESKKDYKEVKLDDTVNTLVQLASMYISKITTYAEDRDVSSSGAMIGAIQPTTVEVNGQVYTIGILAPDYASYQDEGVDGWFKSRGSRFKFKTKGVAADGDMVKSIKKWVRLERKKVRNLKASWYLNPRETKAKGLDAKTRAAVTVAYMIKRQGIEPKNFWRDATNDMTVYIADEFGTALKIDIVNHLLK